MRINHWFFIFILIVAGACSSSRSLRQQLTQAEKDFNDHIGFVLYDPEHRKTLYDFQGDRYFTPASNTKIFTFFSALKVLGDSIPALRYVQQNDSLIFWGTGDPSFLYGNVVNTGKVLRFLRDSPSRLFFSASNFSAEHFGPGWAWGDYNYSYQVERTPFPIYGNRFRLRKAQQGFVTTPSPFNAEINVSSLTRENHEVIRDIRSNALTYFPGGNSIPDEWEIPFHYTDELLVKLLSDTLKKEVRLISFKPAPQKKTLYSVAADSLYKIMMQQSDNFIAEQLLLLCAGVLSDTLNPETGIREVKKKFLTDLPDPPGWVDGSGLSRYNLFTPRSIVRLWEKIDSLIPRERLFGILAVGGVSGTLKNYYKAKKPFVFGKTGTLRSSYALSGFLVAKSGRVLIFSWMNNNFTTNMGNVRGRMEKVLTSIYEKY